MRASSHLKLFLLGALVWAAFWVGGLPDYYQQYSLATMLVLSTLFTPLMGVAGWMALSRLRRERRRQVAWWMSFYFTAPFAVFDYLYCGFWLGHGWEYLFRYWYLTVFYFIPWFIIVPIGWRLSRPAP